MKSMTTITLPPPSRSGVFMALLLALIVLWSAPSPAADSTSARNDSLPTIAQKTSSMKRMDGLLPLYWDAGKGRLYLEIPSLNTELLYVDSLPYGAGSNDLALDRGQMSEPEIVRFERFGPKIL
jgi:hypothetical protein